MVKSIVRFATLLLLAACGGVHAGNTVIPGAVAAERPTIICLGSVWEIDGDDNRNATVTSEYRWTGSVIWTRGPDLFRASASLFAGSVIGLEPGTGYDLRLTLADPDGAVSVTRSLTATTRSPARWGGTGRTLHAVPGTGGGSGSSADPYRGLAEADRAARPGDLVIVHHGIYPGTFTPRAFGEPGNPIVWRGAGDGVTILDGRGGAAERPERTVSGSDAHDLIFERLWIREARWLMVFHRAQRITIRRCRLTDGDFGIVATGQGDGRIVEDFEIADNTIEGPCRWPRSKGIEDPRGIQIAGVGHAVCFNRISGFADGIDTFHSLPCAAIDIHGNDLSEMTDDGIELDYSERNVRCFRNRLTNCFMGISLQPVYGGPVYVLRNEMYNIGQSVFKLHNAPSGALLFHNTAVKAGMPLVIWTSEPVRNSVSRNNLFIGTAGNYAFETTAPMESCDFDYDGFGGGPWDLFMKWNEVRCRTLEEVRRSAPVERHATRVDPATCFASAVSAPADSAIRFPVEVNDLRLAGTSQAIDRGAVIPGINDRFAGSAPDLGAHEFGVGPVSYGPRGKFR